MEFKTKKEITSGMEDSIKVRITLSNQDNNELKKIALEHDTYISEVIRVAIKEFLNNYKHESNSSTETTPMHQK